MRLECEARDDSYINESREQSGLSLIALSILLRVTSAARVYLRILCAFRNILHTYIYI